MTSLRFSKFAGRVVLLLLTLVAAGIPAMAAPNGQSSYPGNAADWIFADFDGDQKPDLAKLHHAFLDLRMSTGIQQHLPALASNDLSGSNIVAFDFDGDNDLDIVVRNYFPVTQVKVWLNDGKGSFTETSLYQDPFPVERDSLIQSFISIPALAIPIQPLKPFAALLEAGVLWPPSFGPKVQSAFEWRTIQRHNETSRLRAPPTLSFD